jgi:hypothetical protein
LSESASAVGNQSAAELMCADSVMTADNAFTGNLAPGLKQLVHLDVSVSGGDATAVLEPVDEAFDAAAVGIDSTIDTVLHAIFLFGRDLRPRATGSHIVADRVTAIGQPHVDRPRAHRSDRHKRCCRELRHRPEAAQSVSVTIGARTFTPPHSAALTTRRSAQLRPLRANCTTLCSLVWISIQSNSIGMVYYKMILT